jgi:hypothetical protein
MRESDAAPGATTLDGGGTNQVLTVQTNGMIVVSHLTIQNGFRGTDRRMEVA